MAKNKNIKKRTEKHIIKQTDKYYSLLMSFCHLSKNLYNHANHIIRQEFINNKKWIRYEEIDKIVKTDKDYPDYANMPTAQTAQQTLKLLDKNWKSFFKSIKDYKRNKDKYLGKPKPPKYLKNNGTYLLILTNQNCKLKEDNLIHFPTSFKGFTVKPCFIEREDFVSFQQIRIIPHKHKIVLEIIYNIKVPQQQEDNNKYIGIDIGVNNLACICNNSNLPSFIINGRPLKSINQYYNKKISYYREVAKRINNKDYSSRMDKLTEKRDRKINDYLHKASRKIIDYCLENDITKIVIGKNKNWKQDVRLNKKFHKKDRQTFVQIPFSRFIELIQYKAEEQGITVKLTEESYTSGTSFIDNEAPIKKNYNKSRRVYRGLFISNTGIKINADLNGAYQILKKVVPIKWDRGFVLNPFVVNII